MTETQHLSSYGNRASLSAPQVQSKSFNHIRNGLSNNWLLAYMATKMKGKTPKLWPEVQAHTVQSTTEGVKNKSRALCSLFPPGLYSDSIT